MEANKATKVKLIESYKDSQGEHIVVKGKLVLIDNVDIGQDNYVHYLDYKHKPIIISETEEIKVGDNMYDSINKHVVKCTDELKETVLSDDTMMAYNRDSTFKILALPEQFSTKHLQAIIDSKLKEGDVYIECEEKNLHTILNRYHDCYRIKLTNNHIKLFPIKQEESWDDIVDKYLEDHNDFLYFDKWLQDNYNPPSKK